MLDKNKPPKHIAIIMDGNGRWAKKKGLPKIEGHRAGAAAVEEAIKGCLKLGVEVLSLYTFSTENWRRPRREINTLMKLLQYHFKKNTAKLNKNKIRLVVSGEKNNLPLSLKRQIEQAVSRTRNNSKLILNLALNYGGREEIVQAAKSLALKAKQGKLEPDEIDHQLFASHLYTRDLPEPELLIRTSGEQRISNFFLWQISYSEFYFTPKLWPDFKEQDMVEAVLDYQKRKRRFGA